MRRPPDPDDPYLLPNGTLRNTLGLTSQADLQREENDITAARGAFLEARLPKPPFTFETLRSIHRELFQDIYSWAGEPRTVPLSKREFDDPASRIQSFARPDTIVPRADALFRTLDDQNFLAGRTRSRFSAGATYVLAELNAIHFAREGNGRSQRLLLTAIAEHAGHPIAFDIVTRERMVAISIAAHQGDTSGLRRMFDEILDPRQVEAMRKALTAMRDNGFKAWNDSYNSTTRAGQEYRGAFAGQAGPDFMMRSAERDRPGILIGDTRDLPAGSVNGKEIAFRATQFGSGEQPAPRTRSAIGSVTDAIGSPRNAGPAPWQPTPIPMADRIRAFEQQAATENKKAANEQDQSPEADPDRPKPSGPRP